MQRMFDPRLEIEDMDARGIDMSVISSSTVLQGTSWADPQTDLDLCRRCNDQAAAWVARYPGSGCTTTPDWNDSLITPVGGSPCPIFAWQYAGDCPNMLDLSQINPSIDANNDLLQFLPLPA